MAAVDAHARTGFDSRVGTGHAHEGEKMKLTLREGGMENWYVIERAEHDGRVWLGSAEGMPGVMALHSSARISDADVEGTGEEMLEIADAILTHGEARSTRCAVDARGDLVLFWSPRNSQKRAQVPLHDAVELAFEIRKKFGRPDGDT
jgi:hypothetical protein